MSIIIIGAGYVGLSFGTVLASHFDVTLVDIDKNKVVHINKGHTPIHEDRLELLLKNAIEAGRLKSVTPDELTGKTDIFVICVDTPDSDDGYPDLSRIESALDLIEKKINDMCDDKVLIVVRSTVPPGTSRSILDRLRKRFPNRNIGVIFQPEFLRQGWAIRDLLEPDRVIIGASDPEAAEQWISIIKVASKRNSGKRNSFIC